MNPWAIIVGGAIYLVVVLLILIPQVRRLEARREEIGEREFPLRWLVIGMLIVLVSATAGAAMIVYGSGTHRLAGWAVAGLGFFAGLQVIVNAASRAQRT
jgi:hypothetical protein